MEVVITARGMVTSVGHNVKTACASIRAGIVRPAPLEYKVLNEIELKSEGVSGYPLHGLTEGFKSTALLSLIGSFAVNDLLTDRNMISLEPDYWKNSGLFLCTSTPRVFEPDSEEEFDTSALLAGLLTKINLPINEANCQVIATGNASCIQAISAAKKLIKNQSIQRALIVAVDSLVDDDTCDYFAENNRLKTVNKATGLTPGEAGAAIMIETKQHAINENKTIFATIGSIALSNNQNHFLTEKPIYGKVLAEQLIEILKLYPKVDIIYNDLNGEEGRALDWGYAMPVVFGSAGYVPVSSISIAEYLGDTGAASGAIALCFATEGFSRKYLDNSPAIICTSSENGDIAIVSIDCK